MKLPSRANWLMPNMKLSRKIKHEQAAGALKEKAESIKTSVQSGVSLKAVGSEEKVVPVLLKLKAVMRKALMQN